MVKLTGDFVLLMTTEAEWSHLCSLLLTSCENIQLKTLKWYAKNNNFNVWITLLGSKNISTYTLIWLPCDLLWIVRTDNWNLVLWSSKI